MEDTPILTLNGVPVYVSGVAGHFSASGLCDLRMSWRIGDYRVSTVAGYRDPTRDGYTKIGSGRYGETFVMHVADGTSWPEGWVVDYTPIATRTYATPHTRPAERGHYAMSARVAHCVSSGTTLEDCPE